MNQEGDSTDVLLKHIYHRPSKASRKFSLHVDFADEIEFSMVTTEIHSFYSKAINIPNIFAADSLRNMS